MTDDAEALATKVLGLRRGGASLDQVADSLGITVDEAKTLLNKALGSYHPEHVQALEADRLDRMHLAVWPKAAKGDLDAVDRVLKISERRDKVLAVPKVNTHTLREAYDTSVASATRVDDTDAALIAAGRALADRVDEAVATGEGQELTKALYLMPHMMNVLREMLATPASRAAADAAAAAARQPEATGKLAELRSIHGARRTS